MIRHSIFYSSIFFFSLFIFSGCIRNKEISTVSPRSIIYQNERKSVSVCASTTRFIDKYTTPETKYCKNVGNGIWNSEQRAFISAKHIFADTGAYYFARVDTNTLFPLAHIQFHPTKDIAYTTPFPIGKNITLYTGQAIITHAKNNQDKSLTLTGKILGISGDTLTTNLPLYPGLSGSPLFTLSGHLIGINTSINEEEKKSYGIVLKKR